MTFNGDVTFRTYRVTWAFDPYASDLLSQRSAIQALQKMTEGMKVEVTPVFLYGAHTYKSTETIGDDEVSQIQFFAQKVVNEVAGDVARNG